MRDTGEELIRRAAALKAESEQLVAASKELAGPPGQTRTDGTAGQREEQLPSAAARTRGARRAGTSPQPGPALPAPDASRGPGVSSGDGTGDMPVSRPGPGILDQDEAVMLAVLLEELAARPGPDLLSGSALQAAALLRRRVAAGGRRGIWSRPGGPAGDRRYPGRRRRRPRWPGWATRRPRR